MMINGLNPVMFRHDCSTLVQVPYLCTVKRVYVGHYVGRFQHRCILISHVGVNVSLHMFYLMIDAVYESLSGIYRNQVKATFLEMVQKQAIEFSQRIALHLSLPTLKVKLIDKRHVSARICRKITKSVVAFEGLVFFFLLV